MQDEQTLSSHVAGIVGRHFAAAGLVLERPLAPQPWSTFTIYMRSIVVGHCDNLKDRERLEMLRALFAEVYDFLVGVYGDGDGLAYVLKVWVTNFSSCIGEPVPTLRRLFPDRASSVLDRTDAYLDADYEDQRRREDQMGY